MMRIRRQRRTTGTPQIFEEEQEPEVWEVFFVGAKAEFGKVPSQAGSREVAVGLNMGWAEYGAAGFVPVYARVSVRHILISTDLALWYTLLP